MGILSAFRFAFQNLFFSPILYGVIASLAVFSSVWENGDRLKDQLTDNFRSQDDTFDFIIVGGGSAGSVLANRLSQYHTVLLLEAGGETHPFMAIPGLSLFIPKNIGTDFKHKSVTQTKSCFSCPNKRYILSQGKNLGGSGNIDYMMYLRGSPLDFNNWATITGDPTWSYEGVLPYFIRSEHFVGETTDKSAHGFGGPLQIQVPDFVGIAKEWNLAGVEMGYPHVDLNGRYSEGFDTVFYPIKHGVRQATYRSYIQPVRSRQSLLIRKFAHVNKILIREGTNEAYGVEYDRHGHKRFAFANKECIISAGTLQTPKLLILSGVGQLEHLNALHIPVKSVLPVGKNLQDHISTLLGPFYISQHRSISFDRDIDKGSFVNFAANGKGPLSSTGYHAAALISSSLAKAQRQTGWPDIQLSLFGLTPHRMFYSDIAHAFGIRQDVLHKYYGDVTGKEKDAFFIMVTLARPLSKGDFCLPSKNPYKAAVIDPNSLSDPLEHDIKVLIEGVQRALFLAENTTTFKTLDTWYSDKCFPGCENVPYRSSSYWECYVRSFSIANNDHVGTCAMGRVGSPYAVVDPELQVQGIKGLRVVDASVMPTIVGTPTQAATIMIAEKASDLILNKWRHTARPYGPPGQKPGPPLHHVPGNEINPQYGPPGKGVQPQPNYGPPVKGVQPQSNYGPPGLSPPPRPGGDGFANFDSFSVIRDQFHPPPRGPTPTPLIPLKPGPQVWSTPASFSNTVSATLAPPEAFNVVSSTGGPPLSSEPSQQLLPPDHLIPTISNPTTAVNYLEVPIVSSTPNYPVSFEYDASRSEKSFVTDEGDFDERRVDIGNLTSSRQGKSFGNEESVSSVPEGNQLGQGVEQEEEDVLHSTVTTPVTPSPTTYFTSPSQPQSTAQTPIKTVTEPEVLNEGPGFRVVRKRIRTTPRVIVHPRGHLGHQNVTRKVRKKLNASLESLFLTTSSVRPVPKEIVTIRKRRPVPFGRRRRPTAAPTTTAEPHEELIEDVSTSYGAFPSTFATPVPTTADPPIELKSPGQKRFVRRMYARPLNFGKKRFRSAASSRNEIIIQSTTTVAPIMVATPAATEIGDEVDDLENDDYRFQERIDLDAVASIEVTSVAPVTPLDLLAPISKGKNVQKLETIVEENVKMEQVSEASPVVVFKNIELENEEELTRQTRSSAKNSPDKNGNKKYYEYNVLSEKNRNPIMPLDLSPLPEILAPVVKENIKHHHETFAVEMKTEPSINKSSSSTISPLSVEDYENEEVDATPVPSSEDDEYNESFENSTLEENVDFVEDESYNSSESQQLVEEDNSSSKNASIEIDQQNEGNDYDYEVNETEDIKPLEDDEINDYNTEKTVVAPVKPSIVVNTPTSQTKSSTTTVNPRFNFRARNKLIRIHS